MTTATRPLRILHLSDTHLFGDGSLHYGVVDTEAALRRVLDRAAPLETVDVVVLSGDLSDDGSAESYRLLRDLVGPWAARRGATVVYAMGNHDLPTGFEAVLGARTGLVNVRGVRIIHLDSSVPGFGYGDLDAVSLDWLRDALSTPAENGTLLVLHHPPVPATTPLLATLQLQQPQRLLELCAAGDVRLVLSGHYHHSLVTRAEGIPVVVAPGVTNTSDAIAPRGRERAIVGAGFAVIDLPLDEPAAAELRVSFIAAAGPDDGRELFDLGSGQIAQIARESGHPATFSAADAL
ncbi:MAG TPA: metallophosphoesterase [Humibacter sp.]|nr:metallophosphoesterase [Humibacter sp.]